MSQTSAEHAEDSKLPLALSYQFEAKIEVPIPCNLQAPFTILNKYRSQRKRLTSDKDGEPSKLNHLEMDKTNGRGGNNSNSQLLSAVSIMRMAEMELSQSKSQKTGDFSALVKAFGFNIGLIRKHTKHLKRVVILLGAAEKFSNREYDEAEKLLVFVLLGSHADHPIERVITCFARYLEERIEGIKGKINLEKLALDVDTEQALVDLKAGMHAFEQKLPFTQICNFTAIQTMLDTLASAERIHFIDLGCKVGSYWILMIDALANRKHCRLEKLKITAVWTPMYNVENSVKMISSFAESMNFPLEFRILHLEIYELEKDRLEIEAGETVVVYLELCIPVCPVEVEALLRGVKNLNPHVIVVSDIEASTSGSTFIDRFKDSVYLCCALFDSHEDCVEQDIHFQDLVQKLYFQEIICNGVLSEDNGTFDKCRTIDFCRENFAKFGIVEIQLSQPSMDQASLMIKESPSWRNCTLSRNGKSMLIGWNGVPLLFVSAWKLIEKNDQEKRSSTCCKMCC